MPVPELMTWVAAQKRWTRMYCGKRYYVSARKLGCPETKEDSLQAANQWWRDKQAEIDYATKAKIGQQHRMPLPMEDVAAASMGVSADLFGNVRHLLEQALLREEEDRKAGKQLPVIPLPDDAEIVIGDEVEDADTIRRREVMVLLERLLFGDSPKLPKQVIEQLLPARVQQVESAILGLRGESAAEPQRTVKHLADAWTQGQRIQASIGNIVPRRYQKLCQHMAHFASFLGEANDVAVIHAERVEGFYNFCLSKICDKREGREGGWSEEHAKNVFNTATRFTRWLWERGTIELPKNLNGRNFRFRVPAKAIPVWTPDEIREAVQASRGILKLSLLLMVNCGFGQSDVSDLLDEEVDWKRGTITRRRSKAKSYKNAPTVTYQLWPDTFRLLKQHRSGTERVVLTQTGRPLVRNILNGDKVTRTDIVDTKYHKLQKRLTFRKPLKQLRKTAASMIENHTVVMPSGESMNPYAACVSLFLGHSPRGMKERHYAAPPQALLDAALRWLGRQLGFVDTD